MNNNIFWCDISHPEIIWSILSYPTSTHEDIHAMGVKLVVRAKQFCCTKVRYGNHILRAYCLEMRVRAACDRKRISGYFGADKQSQARVRVNLELTSEKEFQFTNFLCVRSCF